jgi:putative membrane protein
MARLILARIPGAHIGRNARLRRRGTDPIEPRFDPRSRPDRVGFRPHRCPAAGIGPGGARLRRIQIVIKNFSDHAANERTFLAWVRTAIAVMAFGFLVAKFNVFLRIAAQTLTAGGARLTVMRTNGFGDLAGLLLISAGTVMVAVAAVRFVRTGRTIDSAESHVSSDRADLLLAGLMLILGIALVAYLSETLLFSL